MTQVEIKMEKAMAPHSSTLAWKIPGLRSLVRLQSMRLLSVRHNWATSFHFSLSCIGEGNGNPLQCSCLENPRDGGVWWTAIYGVSQSRTRLKGLSSSSTRDKKKVHIRICSPSALGPWDYHLSDPASLLGIERPQGPGIPLTTVYDKSQQTNEWSHLRPTSPHTPFKLTSDTWANTTEISQAWPCWQNGPADP